MDIRCCTSTDESQKLIHALDEIVPPEAATSLRVSSPDFASDVHPTTNAAADTTVETTNVSMVSSKRTRIPSWKKMQTELEHHSSNESKVSNRKRKRSSTKLEKVEHKGAIDSSVPVTQKQVDRKESILVKAQSLAEENQVDCADKMIAGNLEKSRCRKRKEQGNSKKNTEGDLLSKPAASINAASKSVAKVKIRKKDPSPEYDTSNLSVSIHTVTAAEIRKANNTKASNTNNTSSSATKRCLIRIPSAMERSKIYTQTAAAIADREAAALPSHGGRNWACNVVISDAMGAMGEGTNSNHGSIEDRGGRASSSAVAVFHSSMNKVKEQLRSKKKNLGPLFRWYRGKLELACLPHLLEKIDILDDGMPKRISATDDGNPTAGSYKKTDLQERQITAISTWAWMNSTYPAPIVKRKWLSPDHVMFSSRSSALQHAAELLRRDQFIDRILFGYGTRGVELRPSKPTKKDALEAGHFRFLRDGIWVIGQEEDWLEDRLKIWNRRVNYVASTPKQTNNTSNEIRESVSMEMNPTHVQQEMSATETVGRYSENVSDSISERSLREERVTATTEDARIDEMTTSLNVTDLLQTTQEAFVVGNTCGTRIPSSQQNILDERTLASGDAPLHGEMASANEDLSPTSLKAHFAVDSNDLCLEKSEILQTRNDSAVHVTPLDSCTDGSSSVDRDSEDTAKTASSEAFCEENKIIQNQLLNPSHLKLINGSCETNDEPQSDQAGSSKIVFVCGDKGSVEYSKPQKIRSIAQSNHWRLSLKQIELCTDAVMAHYHKVMYTIKVKQLCSELVDGFDIFRERGRGRYDMQIPQFDEPTFDFLTDLTKASWMPVVRQILGDDASLVHKGSFLSLPGSDTQVYHQDGLHLTKKYQRPCHAVNVFIPLVDLTEKNGPTEFCLGTHILGYEYYAKEMLYTPTVRAGTPIIFDYRLGHRGLGNSSNSARPIVYLTYTSASNEFRDQMNFSSKRYRKFGEILELPLSREERASKRNK